MRFEETAVQNTSFPPRGNMFSVTQALKIQCGGGFCVISATLCIRLNCLRLDACGKISGEGEADSRVCKIMIAF